MLIVVRVGMGAAYEPTSQARVTGTSVRFAQTDGTRTTQITSQGLELHAYKGESSKGTLAEPV
jgi:hypothetical protein